MRKLLIPLTLAGIALIAFMSGIQFASGQDTTQPGSPRVVQSETQGENRREIAIPALPGVESPQAPDIGFIDSPTVTCVQPDPTKDECLINWYYMSVSASPSYMLEMTATINAFGPVAHYNGFFQTSMYVPHNLNGAGFKVPCGALGSGGNAYLGAAYTWRIKARDSENLTSANFGTVLCPAYTP